MLLVFDANYLLFKILNIDVLAIKKVLYEDQYGIIGLHTDNTLSTNTKLVFSKNREMIPIKICSFIVHTFFNRFNFISTF
jgi:hypothetical protein